MINVVSSSTPAMLLDGLLALEGNLDACHIDDGSDHIRVDRKLERILRRTCLRDQSLALRLKDATSEIIQLKLQMCDICLMHKYLFALRCDRLLEIDDHCLLRLMLRQKINSLGDELNDFSTYCS